jgi:hypothetical protein
MARLLHEESPHRNVVVEEGPGVFQVPPDPARVGSQVDHDILTGYDFRACPLDTKVVIVGTGDEYVLGTHTTDCPRKPAPPVTRIFFPDQNPFG